MAIIAFLVVILIASLFRLNFFKILLLIGTIALGVSNLSFWFSGSVSTVVTLAALGIGLMFFWMLVRTTEERKQSL